MRIRNIVSILFCTAPLCGYAQDVGPWKFGMSVEDVRARTEFGPYKTFMNGDLETYSGVFAGAKRNFQFYFKDGKLWRIAIRMYEGYNLDQAADVWRETHDEMTTEFGCIETPTLKGSSIDDLKQQARALVANGTKVQMAPTKQPDGESVFSTFKAEKLPIGGTLITVTINVDPPRNSGPQL